jgi:hypothetical protein
MGARFNLEGRSFAKADQIDRGLTFHRERICGEAAKVPASLR